MKVVFIYAPAGPPPVRFPSEITPESVTRWAEGCQRRYKPGNPTRKIRFVLHRSAYHLWLNREVGWKNTGEVAEMIAIRGIG